jgi:VWFA-related protein
MRLRAVAVVVAATSCALLAAPRQDLRFTARRAIVRIDVLVTKGGQPVTGLQPSEFDVLDNGVLQPLDYAAFEDIPINAILALDMSASVAGRQLERLRDASRALVDALAHDDQAALLTFSSIISLRAPLSADLARVRRALDSVHGRGDTALVDAAYASLVLGETDIGRSLVLVFSDGVDSSSALSASAVIDTAKRGSGVVYAVSPGALPARSFLADLTQATGGAIVSAEGHDDLTPVFIGVLKEFRQRYLISYSPTGVSNIGWHTLEVRVHNAKARGLTIKVRPGYFAGS